MGREIIDVESYIVREVIIINDFPEPLKRKLRQKQRSAYRKRKVFFHDEAAPPQKRKTAEQIRREDIERRQKNRVAELRETRKKEEDDLKLKEIIRDSVVNKLKILERCSDLGSLLRDLGVLSSRFPSKNEVSSAYRKALLRFHPDRNSGSDFRQRVESEEKFKLLLRVKDRFLI